MFLPVSVVSWGTEIVLYTLSTLSLSLQVSCGFHHCVSSTAESRKHALRGEIEEHAHEVLDRLGIQMVEEFCIPNVRTAVEICGMC